MEGYDELTGGSKSADGAGSLGVRVRALREPPTVEEMADQRDRVAAADAAATLEKGEVEVEGEEEGAGGGWEAAEDAAAVEAAVATVEVVRSGSRPSTLTRSVAEPLEASVG